jgi:hypothetical protein
MEVCETPPRGDAASESVSRIPAPDRPGEAPHAAGNCIVLRTLGGIPGRVSHGRNGATETSEGSKAQGGSGALPPATEAAANRTCPRSKASKLSKQQGGNGHGNVVRLWGGSILRRVRNRVARKVAHGSSHCWQRQRQHRRRCSPLATVVTSRYGPKRGEPPDRQQDATSLRPARGENRRGGAKPRGRNGTFEVGASKAEVGSQDPAGVDAQRHVDGGVTNPTGGGRQRPGRAWSSEEERRIERCRPHAFMACGAHGTVPRGSHQRW